jgi:membrane protein YqaA with SNARE-associated domain
MIAYIIAPILAFISSIVMLLPSEVVILVLGNMDKVPLHLFGVNLNIAKYATGFPWLLPVVMSLGSNGGSTIYYFMGNGTLKLNDKFKKKLESFDFDRFGAARDAVIFVSGAVSVPPVSITSIASGMMKYKFNRFFNILLAGKIVRYYLVLILGRFAIELAVKWFG